MRRTGKDFRREGGVRAGDTKKVRELTAGESAAVNAPTIDPPTLGIRIDGYDELRWLIVVPSWCTSLDVDFYRRVDTLNAAGETTFARWVPDETVAGQTEDLLYYQPFEGEILRCRVYNIVGVVDAAEPIIVLRTPVNR